ncbi:MAG: caspase family protein [Bacteroidota bacterium]
MYRLKTTISFLLIISLLFTTNACYVSQSTSNPEIISESGKLVRKQYNVSLSERPTKETKTFNARVSYRPEYKYETKVKREKSYKVPSGGGIFKGFVLPVGLGYYAFTNTPNNNIFKGDASVWSWIGLGVATAWLLSSFGSGRFSKIKYKYEYEKGPIKYEMGDSTLLSNAEVDVLANEVTRDYFTNGYGELNVNLGDFDLPKLQYHRDISFAFSHESLPLGDLQVNSKDFMKTFARVSVPVTTLKEKDFSSAFTNGKALYGMESEVKKENMSATWSYLSFGKKDGWIPNTDLENFYALDYKLTTPEISASVSKYVEKMIGPWQEKGRYEKLNDYRARVNTITRNKKINELTTEALNLIASTYVAIDKTYARLDYDTESELFRIQFTDLNAIYVPVPIAEAANFEENFQNSYFSNVNYAFDGENFAISYLAINHESYPQSYVYNSEKPVIFNATQIAYNFSPITLNLQQFDYSVAAEETESIIDVSLSDVDNEIPETGNINSDGIAVVIGNKDYINRDVPSVDYAFSDAQSIKKYLIKAFGFKEENILYYENATQGNFNSLFGTESNYKGRLYDLIIPNKSDVFVFYSGHGAPDLESKKGFFMPVDCDPAAVALNGYSTEVFYRNLSKLPYKSLTVVLDACFSGASEGGMLIRNASPIFIDAEKSVLNDERSVVFSSSEGDQISSWYPEKYHSLFTYFFLKGLQGDADENADGAITVKEMGSFLKGNVSPVSRRLHRRDQNPQINGEADKVILNLR